MPRTPQSIVHHLTAPAGTAGGAADRSGAAGRGGGERLPGARGAVLRVVGAAAGCGGGRGGGCGLRHAYAIHGHCVSHMPYVVPKRISRMSYIVPNSSLAVSVRTPVGAVTHHKKLGVTKDAVHIISSRMVVALWPVAGTHGIRTRTS